MSRISNLYNNLRWFFGSLPNHHRFQRAVKNVKHAQTSKMLALIQENKATLYGRKHNFERIEDWEDFQKLPITTYSDYDEYVRLIQNGEKHVLTSDPVEFLQPTSGTSSKPKLIPHTKSMMNDFRISLDAWMADLFMNHTGILAGTQYWSISPTTESTTPQAGGVPIGFPNDWDYFGTKRRGIIEKIFAVPTIVKHIKDFEANQYATALFLLRSANLRLISVWHPSFLTLLLDFIRTNWIELVRDIETGEISASLEIKPEIRQKLEKTSTPDKPATQRLKKLSIDSQDFFERLWPNLKVISCWRDGNVSGEIKSLRKAFPKTHIQGKGLLATEGVITIPIGKESRQISAVTSHLLEFLDEKGDIHPLWNLTLNKVYEVVLTTSGGLYRYRLGDRVRVEGFHAYAPSLRFIGRAGVVSDLVGEKLHLDHAEEIIMEIRKCYGLETEFAMIVPSANKNNEKLYNLLLERPSDVQLDNDKLTRDLDKKLSANYHYAHARRIKQLKKPKVTLIKRHSANRFRRYMINRGVLAGTVKFPALYTTPGLEQYLTDESPDP